MSNDLGVQQRVRFGNWMPVRRATLGGLTIPGWFVLLGGLVVMVLFMIRGAWAGALIVIAVVVLFEALFVMRFGGEATGDTIATRVSRAIAGLQRVNRGEARFNSGLFSNLPSDKLTGLPGVLGDLEEIDGTDGRGAPYTLLHSPSTGTLTAVFSCNPDGVELQTQSKTDTDVSWYALWIASLSADSAIAGATVIVDSALRSSEPLVQKIQADIDPAAPEIARRATFEAARLLPARYAELSTWVTVTWSISSLAASLEDAAAEVASKIPYHVDALRNAGGGAVAPATSELLADTLRVAYSPDRSTEIAGDELRGLRSGLRVTQAGPDYFDDSNQRVCVHDGAASMTALILAPPRLHITEDSLKGLFSPSERFLRKRVATFYRPVAPARTVQLAEQMGNTASTMASAKARQTERDRRTMRHAQKLESEVVSGAAMTRFAMAATVTFEPDSRAYREATLKLKSLLESSSLTYRFCDFDTAPAFHATLPLGMLPWLYETQVETLIGAAS